MQNDFQIPGATISLDKIPALGRTLRISVTSEQLDDIAAISRVSAVERLEADIVLEALKGGVRVSGRLRATIIQPCVVTLEAVSQAVDEALNRVFLSGRDDNDEAGAGSVRFVDLEPEDLPGHEDLSGHQDLPDHQNLPDYEDLPDYFEGREFDLSDYLLEVLVLAIDLYPRAGGAEMVAEQKGDDPASLSPFAKLKERRGGDENNYKKN